MAIEQVVKDIIADLMCIGVDTIHNDDGIITVIGCDSLELQEIRFEVENALDLDFEDEEFKQVVTVGDLIALCKKKTEDKING